MQVRGGGTKYGTHREMSIDRGGGEIGGQRGVLQSSVQVFMGSRGGSGVSMYLNKGGGGRTPQG